MDGAVELRHGWSVGCDGSVCRNAESAEWRNITDCIVVQRAAIFFLESRQGHWSVTSQTAVQKAEAGASKKRPRPQWLHSAAFRDSAYSVVNCHELSSVDALNSDAIRSTGRDHWSFAMDGSLNPTASRDGTQNPRRWRNITECIVAQRAGISFLKKPLRTVSLVSRADFRESGRAHPKRNKPARSGVIPWCSAIPRIPWSTATNSRPSTPSTPAQQAQGPTRKYAAS